MLFEGGYYKAAFYIIVAKLLCFLKLKKDIEKEKQMGEVCTPFSKVPWDGGKVANGGGGGGGGLAKDREHFAGLSLTGKDASEHDPRA